MNTKLICANNCLPDTGTANICITNNRDTPVTFTITVANNPTIDTVTLAANTKKFCLTTPFPAGSKLILTIPNGATTETVTLDAPYPSIIINNPTAGSSSSLSIITECKDTCNKKCSDNFLTIINRVIGADITISTTSGFSVVITGLAVGTYLQSLPECVESVNINGRTALIKPFPVVVIDTTGIFITCPNCDECKTCNKCETKEGNTSTTIINNSSYILAAFITQDTGESIYTHLQPCTSYCLNTAGRPETYSITLTNEFLGVTNGTFAIIGCAPTIVVTDFIDVTASPPALAPIAAATCAKTDVKNKFPSFCVFNSTDELIFIESFFSTLVPTSIEVPAGKSLCINMVVATQPVTASSSPDTLIINSKCPATIIASTVDGVLRLSETCKKLCKCC